MHALAAISLVVFSFGMSSLTSWLNTWSSDVNLQAVLLFAPNLIVSILLGAFLGYERSMRMKIAGFRTHMVVSVASCLFAQCGYHMWALNQTGDPARMAAALMSGIGWLGIAVIVRQGWNVSGVTTASTLFFAVTIGAACGLGLFVMAAVYTVVTVLAVNSSYSFFPSLELGGHKLEVVCIRSKFPDKVSTAELSEFITVFGKKARIVNHKKTPATDKTEEKLTVYLHTEMSSEQLHAIQLQLVNDPRVESVSEVQEQ